MFNFSTNENLMRVFSDQTSYKNFRNVASSLVRGNDPYIFDTEGNQQKLTSAQANKVIQKTFMSVLHLSDEDMKSRVKRNRAIKKYGMDLFEVIEEDVDFYVNQGFMESEWFNALVDSRNIALGDATEFYAEDNSLFVVADVSGDNHDITMQQLPQGKPYMVQPTAHAVKIGKDIDLIILGRIDYQKMILRIAASFVSDVQKISYDEIGEAVKQLPGGEAFVKTGELSNSTKDKFDELIENVSAANASDVVIYGTKTALKKIGNFYNGAVDWVADSQKETLASTGVLGTYEGTPMVVVPQRFKVGTYERLFDDTKIYVLPVVEDKFIKFVDEGETEIVESAEKGDHQDDFQTYEVQRRYGVAAVLGRIFGQWAIG